MAAAFDTRPVREFVLESDKALPPEQQTKFLLKRLDVFGYAALNQMVGNDPTASDIKLNVLIEVARCALCGWSNFKSASGEAIEFLRGPTGFATDETMRWLDSGMVGEIATEVLRFENVSKSEAAKSPGGGA